jgi:hypothetical protein
MSLEIQLGGLNNVCSKRLCRNRSLNHVSHPFCTGTMEALDWSQAMYSVVCNKC